MQTGKVQILPTNNTPGVLLDPDGFVKIHGKGMVLDNSENFKKVISWINQYLADPAETTYVTICLEYLNSYCTSKIVLLLQNLLEVIHKGKKIVIYWYYEEDDNDILERGEHISESFNIPFEFRPVSNINNCT